MPTVKVAVGATSVELESGETGVRELADLAIATLRQAHTAEQQATPETAKVGQYV